MLSRAWNRPASHPGVQMSRLLSAIVRARRKAPSVSAITRLAASSPLMVNRGVWAMVGLPSLATAAASGTVGRTTDPIAAALACTLTKTMISPSAERHIQMSKQDIEATAIYFSAP
jgi:hypothetical protein